MKAIKGYRVMMTMTMLMQLSNGKRGPDQRSGPACLTAWMGCVAAGPKEMTKEELMVVGAEQPVVASPSLGPCNLATLVTVLRTCTSTYLM